MDLLNSTPVIELSGDEFLPIEGKSFIDQVLEHFALQGGKANSPFGIVVLDKKGIKNDIAHGIGREKAASFAAIKDVLENGIVIKPMKQYRTNNKKNPTGMIAAPITIGNEKYVCVVVVIGSRDLNRLYVHEVTLTKNLQVDVADTNAVHGDDNHLVTHPQGEIAKVLKNHVISKQNPTNSQETNEKGSFGDSIIPRYNIIKENNQKYCNRNMNPNKKVVRLTESKLKQMIAEAVNEVVTQGKWGDGEWEEWHPYRTNHWDEYTDLDNMRIRGHEPKIERTKTKRTYFDREDTKHIPKDEVLEREQYSLDDVPFDILQKLCDAYKKINVGGAPGTRGRAIAWQEFWQETLHDAVKRRNG